MNFALKEQVDAWLHHPVLGDPSFDSFVHRRDPVLVSQPPFEWTVNGSLFRDPATGKWLLQAGHYADGYAVTGSPSYAELLLSEDEGKTFRSLGPALSPGSPFGPGVEPTSCPDTVIEYDPEQGRYYMAYDTSAPDFTWENAHDPTSSADGGGAVAVAEAAEGPYTRLPGLSISTRRFRDAMGRWDRLYASTLLRRSQDWLMLVLCDSGEHFAWAYAAFTAPGPEGPWSGPVNILSCDRPEFYPAPVEFHPAMAVDGVVYAHATSVALNRNYQALFAAPLEQAHRPEAWRLVRNGSVWHSERYEHEYYGIWGQTLHGFVHDGVFHAMFPSRNSQGRGTICLAQRPWNQPLSDGFTLSGHQGPSQSLLYGDWDDFSLDAEFEMEGTVTFILDMKGIVGPNRNISDAYPIALNCCHGLTLSGGQWRLEAFNESGQPQLLHSGLYRAGGSLLIDRTGGFITLSLGGESLLRAPLAGSGMIGLWCAPHSRIRVSRWVLNGPARRYSLTFNGWEGLLGAGQRAADWQIQEPVFMTSQSYAKYNVIGDAIALWGPKGPSLGRMRVIVDGQTMAVLDQQSSQEEAPQILYRLEGLSWGPHGVRLEPVQGMMALSGLTVSGAPLA